MNAIISPDEFIFDIANRASSKIYNSVCTLFSYRNHKYFMEGSGILFDFNNGLFIVTATHVFERISNLFLPLNNKLTLTKGELWTGDSEKAHHTYQDIIDLALFRIDSSHRTDVLGTYKAMSKDFIVVHHIDKRDNFYLIVANTSSKTKYDPETKMIHTKSFSYVGTIVGDQKYLEFGFQKKFFILLNYSRNKIKRDDSTIKGPMPFGMSGSGLWFLDKIWDNEPSFRLVGILVQYLEKPGIIVALRSFILTELLRKMFNIDLPENKEVDFNFGY